MRNVLLALAASLLAAPAAHALSVQLSSGPTLTVVGGYTQTTPLAATFTITNTGTRALDLGLQRQVIQNVAGSQNNFCFGVGCYPPTVSIAPQPINLAAGATDNSFIGDYEPLGYSGIAIIRYAVYDLNGSGVSADTAYVTVTFDASRPNGLAEELAQSALLSAPFPNPAAVGETITLPVAAESLKASHRVQLTNLADGRLVQQYACQTTEIGFCSTIAPGGCFTAPSTSTADGSSAINISTRGLAPGLYACTLVNASGRPLAVRRLVVR